MLHHFQYRLHNISKIGRLALPLTDPAKFQKILSNRLAAERLLLDHLQVLCDRLLLARRLSEQIHEPAFERLRTEGDTGERVIDFMGDTGGQKADTGEPLGPDQ